ncbi:MAG TPA: hypothetical protein VGO98_00285 [Candidatus Saccharimonadales bacterium]|jgi:hypothetical protein|nr:hypothetical protein [Candidatus Saccharimonadales bacterium]
MNIQIRTKDGQVTKESIDSALEKSDFSETLSTEFVENGVELDVAIVTYDNGVIREFNDLESLTEELGKFGL